jgi:chemotaxis family two-component system response regulator Rcp1
LRIKPVEILLVEDNPGNIRLTIEAFKESKIPNKLNIAEDGIEAIKYLNRKGKDRG